MTWCSQWTRYQRWAGPALLETLLVRGVALLKAILGTAPDGTLS